MRINRPEPDAELHGGQPTVPRVAATVVVLRGSDALEVLMVRRTLQARFMAGAWVFPGGSVDPGDGPGDIGVRNAALREVKEEAGIDLGGPEVLVPYSRIVTPKEIRIRFDTWFFLAAAPDGAEVVIDQAEIVDHRWLTPASALAAQQRDEMFVPFPTIKTLQSLLGHSSAQAALAANAERTVEPVEPRVIGSGDDARIALRGDPDYPKI